MKHPIYEGSKGLACQCPGPSPGSRNQHSANAAPLCRPGASDATRAGVTAPYNTPSPDSTCRTTS